MIFALLLAIIFAGFTILAWRDLKLASIVLLGLLPTYLVRFSIGPIPFTMLEGFLLIVVGVFAIRFWRIPSPIHGGDGSPTEASAKVGGGLSRVPLAVPTVLAISMLAVIVAPDHVSALGIWKAYFLEPVLFGMIVMKVFDKADYEKALRALSVSGAVVGLLAIMQVVTRIGIPDAWAIEGRATSIFPYPNAVGLLLAPIVTAMIVRLFHRWERDRAQTIRSFVSKFGFDVACIALMLGGILAAKTEAAMVAIPATSFVIAMMTPALKQSVKRRVAIVSVIGAIALSVLVPSVATKLTLYDTSGLVRRSQWSETLTMLANHSILGAGLNGYPAALAPYHLATEYEIFQYPHNIFLNAWSELGLIGLIGLMGLMIWATHFAWVNRKDHLVLVSFGAFLTMGIHGLVDVPFFKNDLAVMTVFFIVMMIARNKRA